MSEQTIEVGQVWHVSVIAQGSSYGWYVVLAVDKDTILNRPYDNARAEYSSGLKWWRENMSLLRDHVTIDAPAHEAAYQAWGSVATCTAARDVEAGQFVTTADVTFNPQRDATTAADVEREITTAILGTFSPPYAKPVAPAHRCARCAGPAVELLTSTRCERAGGCRTLDERIGEPAVVQVGPQWTTYYSRKTRSTEAAIVRESYWMIVNSSTFSDEHGDRIPTIVHPTREGAIALWREAAIAAERGR